MKIIKIRNPIVLWLLILFPFALSAQTNLVPNANFDGRNNNTVCPPHFCCEGAGLNCNYTRITTKYWDKVHNWTVPKRKTPINITHNPVGTPDYLCDYGAPGTESGSGHQVAGEYFVVKTNSTLTAGNFYYWEFWVQSRSDNDGDVKPSFAANITNVKYGMGFHKDHPKQYHFNPMGFDAAQYYTSFNTIKDDWIKLYGVVLAGANYNYISIGDYKANSGHFNVDMMTMWDLGSDVCANQWLLESFDFTTSLLWQASTNVISGFDAGNPAPNGNVTVEPSGSITYKAGQMVDLKPGFSAKQGCYFHAYIDDCGSSSQHRFASEEYNNSISVCDVQEIASQMPDEQGITYEWSPADNLSRTDVRNPVFTPPGTDPAYITYTVTATDAEGGKATEMLTVKYSGVNTSPSVRVNVTQADDYNPQYEVILSSNAEKLTAQVWDWAMNDILYEEEMYVFDEINCCNVDYYVPGAYLKDYFCDDLKLKFITNNFCNTNEDEVTIDWVKSSAGPVIGAMPTELNASVECYSIPFEGGMTYDIEVYNDGMELVYSLYGEEVTENPMCVWNGYDNDGQQLPQGVYYPHVWLKNTCTGSEVVVDATQSDGVQLTWGSSKMASNALGMNKKNAGNNTANTRIYPNPTSNSFVYESSMPSDYLTVEDMLGKTLITKENIAAGRTVIDIGNQPAGVYIIRVGGNNANVYKIIKQ